LHHTYFGFYIAYVLHFMLMAWGNIKPFVLWNTSSEEVNELAADDKKYQYVGLLSVLKINLSICMSLLDN